MQLIKGGIEKSNEAAFEKVEEHCKKLSMILCNCLGHGTNQSNTFSIETVGFSKVSELDLNDFVYVEMTPVIIPGDVASHPTLSHVLTVLRRIIRDHLPQIGFTLDANVDIFNGRIIFATVGDYVFGIRPVFKNSQDKSKSFLGSKNLQ